MSPRISGPEFLAQSCLWPRTRVSGSALKPGSWPLALLWLVAPSSGQNLWPETLANSGPDMAQNDRYIIDNKLSTEAGAAWEQVICRIAGSLVELYSRKGRVGRTRHQAASMIYLPRSGPRIFFALLQNGPEILAQNGQPRLWGTLAILSDMLWAWTAHSRYGSGPKARVSGSGPETLANSGGPPLLSSWGAETRLYSM